MNADYLLAAARYVERNPVRATLVDKPEANGWSSARAHLAGGLAADDHAALRAHERTGRPLGDERFVERLESALGRRLKKQKPGPKKGLARNTN